MTSPRMSYADITNVNKGVAPLDVTINSKGHPNLRGHILRQPISDQQIFLLNYGRADTWFFTSTAFDVTTLHNNTHKTYGPYTLHFTLHEKDRINGTLRWVPPTLSDRTLIQALQPYSNKEPSINAIPLTTNRSFPIYTDNPSTIPHYIQINYKNKSLNILIAINDRKQACQTCSSTEHWTNRCQTLNLQTTPSNQTPAQSTLQKTTSPAQTAPAQTIAKPPPTTSSQQETPSAQPAPSPSNQQTTLKKPINPSKPPSLSTTPSKQTSAARPEPDKPSASTALKTNTLLSFSFSDMDITTNFKRKKEDSPTEEKKITKSKKLFHDFKHCRFCLE
ncbi:putative uncharacterized protein DDB_G0290521 [Physella acuta]|uniref:putative uncharacterized protein DDB_G0290521 n=1 Tax=Physella acuta TaxID=109671 RepID=UPI0027DD39C0|nr:putative uncharacterized protein DDB_G0290521 [Physella acuta]